MVHTLTETRKRAAQGEHSPRLARLIGEQFRFVWRLLRRIGVSELEADAAAAEVFAAASQRISDIRVGSERSFLFSTTLHVAARRRRENAEPGEQEIGDGAPALEDLDSDRQSRTILDALLQQMPLELRVVFVLSEIFGLRHAAVADTIGISLPSVASRLSDAQEQFASHMQSDGELSSSLLAAAREEEPASAALDEVLAAAGLPSSSVNLSLRGAAQDAQPSSPASGPRSPWKLAAKWLVMGLIAGLTVASAVYAVSEVSTDTPRDRAAVH